MRHIISVIFLFFCISCFGQAGDKELSVKIKKQDEIIKDHLENGAWKHYLYSSEW